MELKNRGHHSPLWRWPQGLFYPDILGRLEGQSDPGVQSGGFWGSLCRRPEDPLYRNRPCWYFTHRL